MTSRLLILATLLALSQSACSGANGTCTGGAGNLTGNITDLPTGAPLIQPLIAIEIGGLNLPNRDPKHGNPSYTVGQQANYHGAFSVRLPCGDYGVHTYAVGYHCSGVPASNGDSVKVALQPLDPNTAVLPTLGTPNLTATSVKGGAPITLSIAVQAGRASDPLSEQVLMIDPSLNLATALDPPSPGTASGFPNGTWSKSFNAPTAAGTYTYTVVAASLACIAGTANFDIQVVY